MATRRWHIKMLTQLSLAIWICVVSMYDTDAEKWFDEKPHHIYKIMYKGSDKFKFTATTNPTINSSILNATHLSHFCISVFLSVCLSLNIYFCLLYCLSRSFSLPTSICLSLPLSFWPWVTPKPQEWLSDNNIYNNIDDGTRNLKSA